MRRIEETPTEQGQFSATGQTVELRVREVGMKGKRKITCMLVMYLSLSVIWIIFLLIIYAS